MVEAHACHGEVHHHLKRGSSMSRQIFITSASPVVGRPLKLPPRASKDEIACVWEFEIEE